MSQPVILDLNEQTFQENLFSLPKQECNSALDTLRRLRKMNWDQVYRDHGLKWEKIVSIVPPPGVKAVYSLRVSQSMRATAYRVGNVMKFLTISPDHDAVYGRQ